MTLDDIKQLNAYQLSDYAGCECPTNSETDGADFLVNVRDALVEVVENAEDVNDLDSDDWWEVADGAPSVYTYRMWREFVDLGAFAEDVSDFEARDLNQMAAIALWQIADRLCNALVNKLQQEVAA